MLDNEPIVKNLILKGKKGSLDKILVYKGKGCKACGNTGYRGRLGIFEVMLMSEKIKQLVIHKAGSNDILAAAKEDGMQLMVEDGVEKVLSGVTTLEEVLRVTKG